jgi:hypothetical protein
LNLKDSENPEHKIIELNLKNIAGLKI